VQPPRNAQKVPGKPSQ